MTTTPSNTADESNRASSTTLVLMGLLTGLAVAAAFLGTEWSVVRWLGLSIPDNDNVDTVLVVYLLIGGGAGAVLGGYGLRAGSWAIALALSVAGYLLAGKVGMVLGEVGLPEVIGFVLVPIGVVMGIGLGRSDLAEERKLGFAAFFFVLLAIGLPVNLHLLPSAFAPVALIVDSVIIVLSAAVGGAIFLVGRRFGAPGVVLPILLANALAWVVFASLPAPYTVRTTATQADGPPIVLIVVDTLRADHLGTYGYARPTSPNLDALGRRGVVFENVWTHAPWTLPAVGSLFTGRYPTWHGAGVNKGFGSSRSGLRRDIPVLASTLRNTGYATLGLTTNPWTTAAFGFERGFDSYDDRVGAFALPVGIHPLRVVGADPLNVNEFRSAEDLTDEAITQLESLGDSGWFLYVQYMDVHGPHEPLDEDITALELPERRQYVDNYDAAIHRVDRAIGRLLSHVPRDAWIIVTSDHGEQIDENRVRPDAAPAGVRHGHTLYEELLEVPLIIRAPDRRPERVLRLVGLVDVFPTLNEALELGVSGRFDGEPIFEVTGVSAPSLADRILVAEALRWGPEQKAARRGADKLIVRQDEGFERYDLSSRAGESAQVGMAESGSTEMVRALEAALPAVGSGPEGEAAELGAEMRALLTRLGYAEP